MFNKFIAVGNLTKDPESKSTNSGHNICEFRIAVNNPRSKEDVLFIDVETWDKLADVCTEYLAKGKKIIVEGRLKTNGWTNKEGEKRSKIFCVADDIRFLGTKSEESDQEKSPTRASSQEGAKSANEEEKTLEDIPF
jgi:single-strand DNA-binding protein|tara:strand:+ start:415 stop:825 length:411 start_codon:yes stop_codon:yes gene_type:complete